MVVSGGGGGGRARSRDERRRDPEAGRAAFGAPNIDACIMGLPNGAAKPEGEVGSPSIIPGCGCWAWPGCVCIEADPGVTGDRVDSGGVGYDVVFTGAGAVVPDAPDTSTQVLGCRYGLVMKTTSASSYATRTMPSASVLDPEKNSRRSCN